MNDSSNKTTNPVIYLAVALSVLFSTLFLLAIYFFSGDLNTGVFIILLLFVGIGHTMILFINKLMEGLNAKN